MKMRNTIFYTALVLTAILVAASCTKNETSRGSARMQVSLTDGPGDYEALYIEVQDIKINSTSDAENGWVSLEGVRRGTYNLLDLVNGKDTLLADATIPSGRVQQIRLVLGKENYVKTGGEMLKLETPSAQQSGLKLNIHQDVVEGITYKLLLDFNVAKSVHQSGNGKYILKPTIRTVMQAVGGGIKGVVAPSDLHTAVLALQGSDTVASTYTLNGGYLLQGLNTGTYDLHFLPSDTSQAKQVKTGIAVSTGVVTTVDTLHFN
jgi:hypothetical protein